MQMDDLPPGFLTLEEHEDILGRRYEGRDGPYPEHYSRWNVQTMAEHEFGPPFLVHPFLTDLPRRRKIDQFFLTILLDTWWEAPGVVKHHPCAVRNLPKKCFIHHEDFGILSAALFSRIAWSWEGTSVCIGPEDIWRGPWAGNRLDAVLLKSFQEEPDFAEWSNVGAEVFPKLDFRK